MNLKDESILKNLKYSILSVLLILCLCFITTKSITIKVKGAAYSLKSISFETNLIFLKEYKRYLNVRIKENL